MGAHLTHEGHGTQFYKLLLMTVHECCVGQRLKQILSHVHSEVLNAVCDDDRTRVRALLKAAPICANAKMPGCKQTPLTYAASYGRVSLAKQLLAARAEANATDARGISPLMWAAEAGNLKVAAALLSARADPNVRDAQQRRALEHAASAPTQRGLRMVELLRSRSGSSLHEDCEQPRKVECTQLKGGGHVASLPDLSQATIFGAKPDLSHSRRMLRIDYGK